MLNSCSCPLWYLYNTKRGYLCYYTQVRSERKTSLQGYWQKDDYTIYLITRELSLTGEMNVEKRGASGDWWFSTRVRLAGRRASGADGGAAWLRGERGGQSLLFQVTRDQRSRLHVLLAQRPQLAQRRSSHAPHLTHLQVSLQTRHYISWNTHEEVIITSSKVGWDGLPPRNSRERRRAWLDARRNFTCCSASSRCASAISCSRSAKFAASSRCSSAAAVTSVRSFYIQKPKTCILHTRQQDCK